MDQPYGIKEEELTRFSEKSLEANNSTDNDAMMQWFSSNINSVIYCHLPFAANRSD